MLDGHRDQLVQGLSGLTEAEMRERLVPSDTTLLGLVKHMGYIERWWFQIVFAGLDVPLAPTSAAETAQHNGHADILRELLQASKDVG